MLCHTYVKSESIILCHSKMGFCLVIVTCCKYFGTNTPNSLETLPTVGRNKSYSDSWEEKKKKKKTTLVWPTIINFGCYCIWSAASIKLKPAKNSVRKRINTTAALWFDALAPIYFRYSMMVPGCRITEGKKKEKKGAFGWHCLLPLLSIYRQTHREANTWEL